MTAPLPIDVSDILAPLPDPSHEAIRTTFLKAIGAVWTNHQGLLTALTASQGDLAKALQHIADLQAALDALTARVTALEPPPAPTP